MIELSEDLYKEFISRIRMTDGKCWLWVGSFKGKGYGQFSWMGVKYYAHRLAVTLWLGTELI